MCRCYLSSQQLLDTLNGGLVGLVVACFVVSTALRGAATASSHLLASAQLALENVCARGQYPGTLLVWQAHNTRDMLCQLLPSERKSL
jgi:hypothetical protein